MAEGSENVKSGRPTKYKPSYATQAKKLCLLGATNEELADFFEVHVDTIHEWRNVHQPFSDAIKGGKELADANVANRLYERALGFEHPSEEIKIIDGQVERVPIKKIYPPDPVSAIFWLKNRQPKKWRDKQVIEDPDGNPLAPPVINVQIIQGEAPPLMGKEEDANE